MKLERISIIVDLLWYLYFQPFILDKYTFTIKRYKELSYVNYVIAVRMKTRLTAWGGWWPGLGRAGMWCDPCCCWRPQHTRTGGGRTRQLDISETLPDWPDQRPGAVLDKDAVIWLELLRLLFTVQMSTPFMSAAAARPFSGSQQPAVSRNLFMFAVWAIIWRCLVCGLGWAPHACLPISNLCDGETGR